MEYSLGNTLQINVVPNLDLGRNVPGQQNAGDVRGKCPGGYVLHSKYARQRLQKYLKQFNTRWALVFHINVKNCNLYTR